jgi:hypothetical protein
LREGRLAGVNHLEEIQVCRPEEKLGSARPRLISVYTYR